MLHSVFLQYCVVKKQNYDLTMNDYIFLNALLIYIFISAFWKILKIIRYRSVHFMEWKCHIILQKLNV